MGCSICKNATEACSRMPVCLFEEPPRSELATLRAEIEQLRRERDAIRNKTLHKAAMTGYRVCAETRHVTLGGKVEDAIRNLKEPSDVQP